MYRYIALRYIYIARTMSSVPLETVLHFIGFSMIEASKLVNTVPVYQL